jgi:hypothetical protein
LTFSGLNPDPVILSGNVGQVYKFDTIRFTIFVSNTTQYTLNWDATSLGWGVSNSPHGPVPPEILVEILDAQGGALDSWDVGHPDEPCGGTHPVVFTDQNGKTGILNNNALQVTISIGGSTFAKC